MWFSQSIVRYSLSWFGSRLSSVWATSGTWAWTSFCYNTPFIPSANYMGSGKSPHLLGLRFLICTRKKFTTFHKCAARKCVQHIVIGPQWTLTKHWINKRQRLYLSYLPLSSPQMPCVLPTTNECSLGVCKTSKIGWWWRHRRLESILNWQVLLSGKESLGLSL